MTNNYGSVSSSSDSDDFDDRPKKKARTGYAPSQRRFMLEEVDLEIAMHERIASVLESRMTWALLLQRTLENSQSNVPWTIPGFQDSVVTALEAVEEPCNVLHNQNLRVALAPAPTPSADVMSTLPAPSAPPEEAPYSTAYATRRGGTRRGPTAPPRKLLYLLNRTTQPPQTVKLACPDCAKTSFSSLQGLLNHCRLSHSREFGSHDECVQRCAVLVESAEEQAWTIANGTEVAGIGIPGLKRLFELAVGGGQAVVPVLPPTQLEARVPELEPPLDSISQTRKQPAANPEATISDLTRTLGHHIDTPSLAPFLGRESKRRSIRVFDEDVDVDVLGTENAGQYSPWRMHYTHRSKARASLDQIVQAPAAPPDVEEISPAAPTVDEVSSLRVAHGPGSRFHITARVSIQDLSLWIPPARRSLMCPEHTHKWRIAVSSPSYSLPLSTFLTKLTITCLTEPPPSTFSGPITITNAPFVVTSTTDRPFLARLTFEWTGPNELNPSTSLEHWVDLDPIHYSAPILGEEQFFDVELDRHTHFLPESTEQPPVEWTVESDLLTASGETRSKEDQDEEPDYVVRLRSLLPQFPMTAKDVKGRLGLPQVPYTLVSTPSQLRNLVYGRRKAIEWSRARAIQSAYHLTDLSEDQDARPPPVSLTVGDVFHWLEDEGLFGRVTKPRSHFEDPPPNIKQKMRPDVKSEEDAEVFCRFCGLHFHLHPTATQTLDASDPVKQEPAPDAIPSKPSVTLTCQRFQSSSLPDELPVVDVNRLIANSSSPQFSLLNTLIPTHGAQHSDGTWSRRNLLSTPSPQLVRALARVLAQPCRSLWTTDDQEPGALVTLNNRSRITVDDELAPAALLALMVKPLVKMLVKSGIDTYRQDEAELPGQGRRARKDIPVRRLLTPMHVMRGLQQEAHRSATASALLLALSPLEMSLSPSAVIDDFSPTEYFR